MQSEALTVEEYLSELSEDRRQAIQVVRQTILQNLPEGYEEVMNWGMITYQVPLEICPNTYNGKPLLYAALASQKQHMSVYLTGIYIDDETLQNFEAEYKATGKRYDVGKSCVRFKKLADLPLPLIGRAVGLFGVAEFVERANRARTGRKPAAAGSSS